jgi:RNA polymerase sigma factor (TIGR02999 family)
MTDVTQILAQIEQGDAAAAEQLLPLVYTELRRLAAARLAHEKPGQTLEATALVHEAYLRLVGSAQTNHWDGRGHFFAAAAEAMRRILVDIARRKAASKHGGGRIRRPLDDVDVAAPDDPAALLDLDDALTRLAQVDAVAAELVKLRYFAGLTMDQIAHVLGMSPRNAYYTWTYARSWLHRELRGS